MRMNELTRKDLTKETDKKSVMRSRLVGKPVYKGVTEDLTVVFTVASAYERGLDYLVKCQLSEYHDLDSDEELSVRDRVRLALAGDIRVSCTCPAFLYWGYDYIVSELDSKLGDPEKRFPHVRNPKLEGSLCKHSYRALQELPINYMRVVSDVMHNRFLR